MADNTIRSYCNRYDILGRMINNFRQSVINSHLVADDSNKQTSPEIQSDTCE